LLGSPVVLLDLVNDVREQGLGVKHLFLGQSIQRLKEEVLVNKLSKQLKVLFALVFTDYSELGAQQLEEQVKGFLSNII
jgi:hypothetical protein